MKLMKSELIEREKGQSESKLNMRNFEVLGSGEREYRGFYVSPCSDSPVSIRVDNEI